MGLQGSSLQFNLFGKMFAYKAFVPKAQLSTESRKPRCPYTQQEGPHRQDHSLVNAWVLSNLLFKLGWNEQKTIVWAKICVAHIWNHLQNHALRIKPTPNLTLVRSVSSNLFALLSIPTWGVRSIPLPCDDQAKEWWWSCQFNSM
jgi:hypothetical protein